MVIPAFAKSGVIVLATATVAEVLAFPHVMGPVAMALAEPSPAVTAGLTAIALLAVKSLADIVRNLLRARSPREASRETHLPINGDSGFRDTMLREFATLRARLDNIESEVKINRERYHDLAGVLSTVAVEMKLLLAGRIKQARE